MIFASFFKALGQIGDPRFRRVMGLGVLLALALLAAVYAGFLVLINSFVPGTIDLIFVGPITGIDALLGWGSLFLMLGLSVFLMVPVASAFSGLFLEDIADAVEDRHYPGLPPVTPVRLGDSLVDSLNFLGLVIAANVLALVLYIFAGPFIPVVFWAVNGWLLGREYFTLVATRRIGREGAKALRAQNSGRIWLAGILMAAPLSVPLVNLVIPVLGVATFTHLFHRMAARG
ncbi:CysZ-like protein [Paracoccaceae bacterium]|jgi:uncharacterized protein involved in cysteine biosynthesis